MTDTDSSLEGALARMERDADALVRSLSAAVREAKKAKASAANGQLRDLRAALESSARLTDEAAAVARDAKGGWTFDEQEHFSSGAFTAEVLALAAEEGVQVFESDDRILSYPAVVSVVHADTTVLIDKAKDRRVRPSVLVRTLRALQNRPPKFKPEAFLEALATAYDLVVASTAGTRPGSTVKLVEVYKVFTVMPGSGRDYTKQELARDLYLLDLSERTTTKDGRTLQLPASALTRGSGVLTTVTRSGQEKVYAGISFTGGGR
ncbi:MAG: hypothetical protein M3527_06525 [Actinomycetota bacterium]|nr:hypothetical protein [Acidimicrobiia bacterium]MDQ3294086.1 hypothetical protein [Actinomycetota bacterium]